jgi:hypothetical protein
MIQTKHQWFVDMKPVKVSTWHNTDNTNFPASVETSWADETTTDGNGNTEENGTWREASLAQPLLAELARETAIRIVWRGETWPKFTVMLTDGIAVDQIQIETLGAACVITCLGS